MLKLKISKRDKERLEQLAEEKGLTINQIINQSIKEHLFKILEK